MLHSPPTGSYRVVVVVVEQPSPFIDFLIFSRLLLLLLLLLLHDNRKTPMKLHTRADRAEGSRR